MKTIHVLKPFVLVLAAGERVPYAAGTHRNIPAEHAEHWFTKLHCGEPGDLPEGVVDPSEFAAMRKQLEAVSGVAAERDTAVAALQTATTAAAKAVADLETANAEVERLKAELVAAHAARQDAEAKAAGADAARQDAEAGLALEAEARATVEAELKAANAAKKPGTR